MEFYIIKIISLLTCHCCPTLYFFILLICHSHYVLNSQKYNLLGHKAYYYGDIHLSINLAEVMVLIAEKILNNISVQHWKRILFLRLSWWWCWHFPSIIHECFQISLLQYCLIHSLKDIDVSTSWSNSSNPSSRLYFYQAAIGHTVDYLFDYCPGLPLWQIM